MKISLQKTIDQFKALLLCGLLLLIIQKVIDGANMNIAESIVGIILIIVISLLALKIKEMIPLTIPAFAWASLLTLLVTLPISPVADTFLAYVNNIKTGQIATAILAVAGVSIGTRLGDMKKLSWKIVIIAVVVFIGTFFGSALIAQLILKLQGII